MYVKKILFLGVILFCIDIFPAFASSPIRTTLAELVKKSDHILVGHVYGVDMIDGKGEQITDLNAKTGPGLKNKIRLLIKVKEVYTEGSQLVPATLKVPLDSAMHYRFGQVKKASEDSFGKDRVILLTGDDYRPPIAGHFMRSIELKDKILMLKGVKNDPLDWSPPSTIKKDNRNCTKPWFLWWQHYNSGCH